MIELDDGVLSLKLSIRFFSLSRFRPMADPYFLPFSIYDIQLQGSRSNNLRNVSSTHVVNSLPLFSNKIRHIAWLYSLIYCCIVSLRTNNCCIRSPGTLCRGLCGDSHGGIGPRVERLWTSELRILRGV
jgi:hypothetical protein